MNRSDALLADKLLQHESFVRRTLRALLRDDAAVDDALQETWLQALRHGSLPGRGWLATTARNAAISRWRSDASRRVREEARDWQSTVESAESAHQRVEERQRIVQSIMDLSEPYRGVVLMRYEEGLRVAEIARRTERSQGTVRSQLSRAHEILRAKLDQEFGERRHWAALAAPAIWLNRGNLVVGGLAALAALVGLWALQRSGERTATSPSLVALESPGGSESPQARSTALVLNDDERVAIEPQEKQTRAAQVAKRPYEEKLLGRAELLERSYYDDYERATFNFSYGLRDDPGLKLTRNRWHLLYQGGEFTIQNGVVASLGRVSPQKAADLEIASLTYSKKRARIRPLAGHSYVILTDGRDVDLATLIHVVKIVPGKSCLVDWYTTDGTGRAQGSFRDDRNGRPIVDALVRWRELYFAGNQLQEPEIQLQLRAGAGGGNPNRVDITGRTSIYVDEKSEKPLLLEGPVDMHEPSTAYARGGVIPRDKTFVVTSAKYEGTAKGDSNGSGEFILVVAGQELEQQRNAEEPIFGLWNGRLTIDHGEESETYLEIANSSTAGVTLRGFFEPRKALADIPFGPVSEGFLGDHHKQISIDQPLLASPDAVLQVRAGAGGGNPNRIDLRGLTSIYIDHVRTSPLDFSEPVTMKTRAEVYGETGYLAEDQKFVITRVSITGTRAGDSNGSGYIEVRIGDTKIVKERNGRERETSPVDTVWTGEVTILPGEESRVYAEVGNSSTVDVRISGRFEKRD